jgi:hypothetical protein
VSPRPFTALATALALAAAALAPLWAIPAGPRAAQAGAKSVSVAGGACCGEKACCETGSACGTDACATDSPGAPKGAPAPAPSTHSVPEAVVPMPADCPRLSAGCGGGAPAVLAGAFDPMVRDDAAAAPVARTTERATPSAAPAPLTLPRDPREPPPRA